MRIDRLDHLVLTVRDIPTTLAFYEAVLGMRPVRFAADRWALACGSQKLNLHQADRPVDPNVRHATPGSADFCLVTATPLAQIMAELARHGVPVLLGPVRRTGAVGELESVYIYDPDENLVELSNPVES
jgi:catechol 2,3-dioxygenase-like lactoylglutathione lyase family enzyme